MRGSKAVVIALAASAAPAAAGAATRPTTVYDVARANGSLRVSFDSDASTCIQFGTCGTAGTITYTFGGRPHGRLAIRGNRRVRGRAVFTSRGRTVSNVTGARPCSATVRRRRESFGLASTPSLTRLLVTIHGPSVTTDHLATRCAGPTERDLAAARALPQASFRRRDFRSSRISFALSGTHFFRARGYRGSVGFAAAYRIVRR